MEFKAFNGGILGGTPNHSGKIQVPATRSMTSAEIAMAKTIFKDSINYKLVKICRGNPFHNITGNARVIGNAMTFPDKIYNAYTKDGKGFSDGTQPHQVWFMHEMVHIWQNQLGSSTLKQGACILVSGKYFGSGAIQNGKNVSSPKAYSYDIAKDGIDFPDYGMEQQAEIVAHYFEIIKYGQKAEFYHLKVHYERLLNYFLQHPNEPLLLPKQIPWTNCVGIAR